MIVLACETSTLLGSVAVVENGKILSVAESMRQGSHSDVLHPFIEKALQDAGKKLSEIDLFASGIGPGSFTGIRISLNAIKTFAYMFNKPLFGLNSLNNLAYQAAEKIQQEQLIVPMINAYKNMLYIATYKNTSSGLVEVKKPEVLRVQNIETYLREPAIICGDGFTTYESYFTDGLKQKLLRIDTSDEPHAKFLGLIASQSSGSAQAWNALTPLYLRASEAEENLKGIKYQPLK